MTQRADVLVVGGGVIGCAVAHALAREGCAVAVLERDAIGAHASSVAAGMLTPLAEAHGDDDALPLGLESLAAFPALCAELRETTGIDPRYRRSGVLRVAATDAEAVVLRARAARLVRHGVEWLDAAALRARAAVAPSAAGALWSPGEGHVDAARLVRGLAAAAASHGARLVVGAAATALETSGDRVTGVRSTAGRWSAGAVVLATGPWASALPGVDLPVPIRPVRGQLVELEGVPLPCIVWGEGVYLVPRDGGGVLAGATVEDAGFDCRTTVTGVRALLDAAVRLAPALAAAGFAGARAGLRPATPDGLPVVGPMPGREGLLLAVGHHRNGILLAPATARIVADLALGKAQPDAPAPFAPTRALPARRGRG